MWLPYISKLHITVSQYAIKTTSTNDKIILTNTELGQIIEHYSFAKLK